MGSEQEGWYMLEWEQVLIALIFPVKSEARLAAGIEGGEQINIGRLRREKEKEKELSGSVEE